MATEDRSDRARWPCACSAGQTRSTREGAPISNPRIGFPGALRAISASLRFAVTSNGISWPATDELISICGGTDHFSFADAGIIADNFLI
jgi:hypothetical protein